MQKLRDQGPQLEREAAARKAAEAEAGRLRDEVKALQSAIEEERGRAKAAQEVRGTGGQPRGTRRGSAILLIALPARSIPSCRGANDALLRLPPPPSPPTPPLPCRTPAPWPTRSW